MSQKTINKDSFRNKSWYIIDILWKGIPGGKRLIVRGDMKLLKRRTITERDNDRGSVMVEAAIALPLFLVCVIVGLDLLRIAYTALSVQFIATVAMRQATLGESTNNQIATHVDRLGGIFFVPIDPNQDVRMCHLRDYPANCHTLGSGFSQGTPGELAVLRVQSRTSTLLIGRAVKFLTQRPLALARVVVMRMEPEV